MISIMKLWSFSQSNYYFRTGNKNWRKTCFVIIENNFLLLNFLNTNLFHRPFSFENKHNEKFSIFRANVSSVLPRHLAYELFNFQNKYIVFKNDPLRKWMKLTLFDLLSRRISVIILKIFLRAMKKMNNSQSLVYE